VGSARLLMAARIAAMVAVSIPAIGIGAVTLWQAAADGDALSLNQRFHLGLGLALLVLFCEFAVAISRSRATSGALLLGAGGFAASVVAAIAVELLGPAALLVLAALTALWAIRTASSRRRADGALRTGASA
jgi:hypothetical protein